MSRDTLGASEAGERQHGWTGGLGLLPEVPAQVDEVTATGMNADRTKFSKNFPRTVPYFRTVCQSNAAHPREKECQMPGLYLEKFVYASPPLINSVLPQMIIKCCSEL